MKQSAVASALIMAMGTYAGVAQAAPLAGEFCMFDNFGGAVSDGTWGTVCDQQVTGAIDTTTFSVTSPQKFFNQTWVAHDGVLLGAGQHTIDTLQSGTYDFTVGTGQVGGHILFDWGAPSATSTCGKVNCDIDVVNVWDVSCIYTATAEECTYTSTDVVAINPPGPDGILGLSMIDGAFAGFNANFNFTATYPLPGAPTFTPPADISQTNTTITATPATVQVALGTVTDENPTSAVVEYSIDGLPVTDTAKVWIDDDDASNVIDFTLTQTVNTLIVDWRATTNVSTLLTQKVTVAIDDQVPPTITSKPADVSISVASTADSVCFGTLAADDAIDPNSTIEWSHDGFTWNTADPVDNCSTGFGPNANTIDWRAVDASGNTASYTQNVILNLPTGITGKACTVELSYAAPRLIDGRFTMRDPSGALSGSIDDTVTGDINTTVFCNNTDPAVCNPVPPAASLVTQQAFFGSLWTATPIRLYGPDTSGAVPLPKTWTFETCPFPRTYDAAKDDWIAADGSTKCGDGVTPNLLSMTVKPGQVGAHMLFDWSVNVAIDVVVAWDAACNNFELTTTDPDGDGILGTNMVDGPFKGFNAAFDVNTTGFDPLGNTVPAIANGGYTTTVPAVQNPVSGASPLPLAATNPTPAVSDPAAVRSCVGDCFEFTTTVLLDGDDGTQANPQPYKYTQVVLPLTEATPFWSLYRKFDNATQSWGPFTIDGRNNVKTAPLDIATGECPEPGNGSYDRKVSGSLAGKLGAGDWCVQLTIEDGGPNDADGLVNGSVSDPGGVAEVPATPLPEPETSGGGGCSLSAASADASKGGAWWLLAGFLTWLGWKRRTLKTR